MNILNLIASATPGGGDSNPIYTIIPFALIIFIFYFMIIRPQQKRQKERQQLLESVKKGDKIITIGGVHGTVAGIEEKSILIEISDGVKVKYEKTAISSINRPSDDSVGKTS